MDFIFRTVNSYVQDIGGKELVILSNLTDFAHIFEVKLYVNMKTRKIIKAEAEYYKTPYAVCNETKKIAKELEGIEINKGVIRQISKILSGEQGCVHLFELVENAVKLASTILIGKHINYFSDHFRKLSDEDKILVSRQYLKNTCLAYSDKNNRSNT